MTIEEKNNIMDEQQTIIKNENLISQICYLKNRWKDEREFEDFSDYVTAMKDTLKTEGYELVKLTKTFAITLIGKYATYLLKFKGGYLTVYLDK